MKINLAFFVYCFTGISFFATGAQAGSGGHVPPGPGKYQVYTPVFSRTPGTAYAIKGVIGEYIAAVKNNWLMKVPDTNPAMLDMFAVRDTKPYKNYLPWSGEFAGKYLTGAVLIWGLTHDQQLRSYIQTFVNRLVALQDPADGYLGPLRKNDRLTGWDSVSDHYTWEQWNHCHIVLGLLTWYEDTGDIHALNCAVKIGNMMCNKFLHTKMIGSTYRYSTEMNQSLIYGMTLLYKQTGTRRYLDLAHEIVQEFQMYDRDTLQAGDYVRQAVAGKAFYQIPRHRWESLYDLLGIGELFYITGKEDYKTTLEHFWWSIARTDIHNNGGFSSREGAVGNPYDTGAIETCPTVAWVAMSVEMLGMTGNSVVADELEMTTLNQVIGYQSPDGLWCTYNTPMDGKRIPGTKAELAFQIRPGSEDINCCSANAPGGFGYISSWALMHDDQGLVLNWYGPSTMSTQVNGTSVTLRQATKYPANGEIKITVDPGVAATFSLKLRIPYWSRNTTVKVNGAKVSGVTAGQYLVLNRQWQRGDVVAMSLDMSLRYWKGEREYAGKTAVYRGPLLLVREEYPDLKKESDVMLDANTLNRLATVVAAPSSSKAQMIVEISQCDDTIRLRDYGTAGTNRRPYRSWLNIRNTALAPFSRQNPGRSWRP